jgi:DNA-directed RNA polymerase specialized sigma24 family protein
MRIISNLGTRQETQEATLLRFDSYIVYQAQHLKRSRSLASHPVIVDLEIDELIQRVRINFWRTLAQRDVTHPYAYIKRMIHNEFISMLRQQKPTISLPMDDEYSAIKKLTERFVPDPAEEVEQKTQAYEKLQEIIRIILKLPKRQRLAMICLLQERVDDREQLIQAFRKYKVDIEAISWPREKKEKMLIQASLAPARKTLMARLNGSRNAYASMQE